MVSRRLDIITDAALSLSIIAIVIVIVSTLMLRRHVTSRYHEESDAGLEVSAIVSEYSQRMKRLEENLVDQKVKLEILELRVQRASGASVTASSGITKTYESLEPRRETEIRVAPQSLGQVQELPRMEQKSEIDKRPGSTEREALRLVFEGRGSTTAKDIQQKIGRTREHTARMMNGLFQEGLVERDVTVRPFSYSITQKGRDLLNS